MKNPEILALMDRFERSAIRTMRLSMEGVTLEMSKDAAPAASLPAAPAVASAAQAAAVAAASEPDGTGEVIAAPLAGVFYAASAPGAAPYVAVGDRVKQGETVCLMEAMKMISEIPAPCDCVITEILKENGVLAGFDEPLFRYTPC